MLGLCYNTVVLTVHFWQEKGIQQLPVAASRQTQKQAAHLRDLRVGAIKPLASTTWVTQAS